MKDYPALSNRATLSNREFWFGLLFVWIVFFGLCEAKLWRPQKIFTIQENVQIAEAQAWWQGKFDLPERKFDTALFEDRVYSPFPPMFSIVSAMVVPFFNGVPHWLIVVALVLPVLVLAYLIFLRITGSALWGGILAIGFVCGTSAFPVLDKTLRGASPYYVNHTLALLGLLILLHEMVGRRRILLAGVGVMVAVLSRQLTLFYMIPLIWLALQHQEKSERKKQVVLVCGMGLFLLVINLTFNTVKFNHPLDTGYMHIFENRSEDVLVTAARQHGLFSPHFVPMNLYYANLGFPKVHKIKIAGEPQTHLRPNNMGTGIWWTTPILLWLVVDFRRIVSDRRKRMLLLAAGLVFVGLMFYHSTGYSQRGFNRYSMDYLPVLFVLAVPGCIHGWRRWLSIAMIVWSVVYFRFLI